MEESGSEEQSDQTEGNSTSTNDEIPSPHLQSENLGYVCPTRKFEDKLRILGEEHEMLNSSLCALTTHFAQVQFRLRQAVAAPQEDKEALLKSLEEFAFRGIPDVGIVRERLNEAKLTEGVWLRRIKQQQLIEKLKSQIKELQNFYNNEKAKMLKDAELKILEKKHLEIDLKKHYKNTIDDMEQKITETSHQLMNSLKMKDELTEQLKIQIADLERFVNYLHDNKQFQTCKCNFVQSVEKPSLKKSSHSIGLLKRTSAVLHMFAIVYLGCTAHQYNKTNSNHWGDLRAKLEMAIANVIQAIETSGRRKSAHGEYISDNEFSITVKNVQVTSSVRKHLAIAIRDLMQHGACKESSIYRLVPFFECFKQKYEVSESSIHAWEIILYYYHLKNGEKYNSTPAWKLSQSFDLDIDGFYSRSNKHKMLSEIAKIISTHSVYKQNYDSYFKAFICAGLNANKLVTWLRLIFQCHTLLQEHYHSWSYALKTCFSDSLRSLDVLTNFKFDLPVNIAVLPVEDFNDAFI